MAVAQVVYEVDGWGTGELVIADGLVVWHESPWPRARTSLVPSQTPSHPGLGRGVARKASPERNGFVAEVIARLHSYFEGDCGALDGVPVDLEHETSFCTRCAEELRAVPPGEVVTYSELAALAGAPGAARAAGTFCARNRLGLFVPCHRVVAAADLGSYGSAGVEYKRRLLALEGYPGAL
ncbi:MAG TPA: methylated-DNA--[protein]-cysteine S-methyltransferase [Gaiellaceae bacterium]|nr:methylated-DNA--[protein]-cysteine S-methyltransferase [Gaiellaceae bacterium]